jgi:hypothetical protein
MTTLEMIKAARLRIAKPEAWTKFNLARTAIGGEAVMATSERATCWCSIGALNKEWNPIEARSWDENPGWTEYNESVAQMQATLRGMGFDGSLARFNDSHSHDDVLEVFDKTIARLEAADVIA